MYDKEYKSLNIRIGLTALFLFVLNYFLLFSGADILRFFGYNPDGTAVSVINAFLYLFCFMTPVLFFRIISGKKQLCSMKLGVKMNTESLMWIPAGIGVILAAAIFNNDVFSFIDYSAVYEETFYDTPWEVVLDFIAGALVPAVCEEFLFRGCFESNLLPYGKQSAIFVSAFLFAAMHGNFIQFFYTFCAGLVLGFVYAETGSIWPGMIIHMFNNFVSTIETLLVQNLEKYTANLLYILIDSFCLLAGLVFVILLIIRKSGKLLNENRSDSLKILPKARIKAFLNPATVIFLILSIYDAGKIVLYTFILGNS